MIYCHEFTAQNLVKMPGFALGIEEEILFAPTAKRLERIARPNAQLILQKSLF